MTADKIEPKEIDIWLAGLEIQRRKHFSRDPGHLAPFLTAFVLMGLVLIAAIGWVG